jgi:hypothetical protein
VHGTSGGNQAKMTRQKTKRKPASTTSAPLNAGAAVFMLLVLGVGVREGAMTAQFWQQVLWGAGAFVVASTAVWLAAFAAKPTAPLHRAPPQQRQTLAYLATAAGLLFVIVNFWLVAAGAVQTKTLFPAAWLPFAAAAVLPVLFAAAAIQASLLPPAAWDARRLSLREINVALLLSIPALLLLPGGASGWREALHLQPKPGALAVGLPVGSSDAVRWLAPVLATGVALFIGQTALHALRRPGAALMVFTAVLFYQATANFVFAQTSGATTLDAAAHVLALLAAVVLDVVYMIRVYAADDRRTLWYALAVSIVMAAGTALLLLPRTPSYPSVAGTAIVGVMTGSATLGLWCGWGGASFGRWMRVANLPGSSKASWKIAKMIR